MRTKHVVFAGIAALVLDGCGGGSPEELPQDSLDSTEQALIYPCPYVTGYIRTWTTNGVETGYERCECDGTLTQYGTKGSRYTQTLFACCF